MIRRLFTAAATALVLAVPAGAQAGDLLVTKRTFEMPTYTTTAGAVIKKVKVGWESAGTLNADKSNAILITHFFSGTSHAFGKYHATDKAPGYWNAVIGPGKAVDTDKYFVLSSDTLVNLNAHDPNVVTTGPASLDPDTGRPYGMSFPVVGITDWVNVQVALVRSLGITRLKAVMGPSGGALQVFEWAASHPEMVERAIPVIGLPSWDAFLIEDLECWAAPIRLDRNWNHGDYYGHELPTEGLKASLKLNGLQATHWEAVDRTYGAGPADPSRDPAKAMDNLFKVQAAMDASAAAKAGLMDANHFLYIVKANQLANADPARIKAPLLMLYAPNDLIVPARQVEDFAKAFAAAGGRVTLQPLTGPYGHLNGIFSIGQGAEKIAAFLAEK